MLVPSSGRWLPRAAPSATSPRGTAAASTPSASGAASLAAVTAHPSSAPPYRRHRQPPARPAVGHEKPGWSAVPASGTPRNARKKQGARPPVFHRLDLDASPLDGDEEQPGGGEHEWQQKDESEEDTARRLAEVD